MCVYKTFQLLMLFVFKGTNQDDPAFYEKLTSSLKRMHSLKRFAVFSRSFECPLMRSLLLGTLCNKSTTEVFISNSSVCKCTHTKCLMRMVWSTLYTNFVTSPSSDGFTTVTMVITAI